MNQQTSSLKISLLWNPPENQIERISDFQMHFAHVRGADIAGCIHGALQLCWVSDLKYLGYALHYITLKHEYAVQKCSESSKNSS